MAAGGLFALGGEPGRQPLRLGRQTALIAGVHAATAALIALHVLETESRGQSSPVRSGSGGTSARERRAVPRPEGVVRRRAGAGPREAGTGLFRCADGWIYLSAASSEAVGVERDCRVARRWRFRGRDRLNAVAGSSRIGGVLRRPATDSVISSRRSRHRDPRQSCSRSAGNVASALLRSPRRAIYSTIPSWSRATLPCR